MNAGRVACCSPLSHVACAARRIVVAKELGTGWWDRQTDGQPWKKLRYHSTPLTSVYSDVAT